MPCLSSQNVPSHILVSRLPTPSKLHSPRIPIAPCSCPFPYGAQLADIVQGNHMQINACCALCQVSIFFQEGNFHQSAKHTQVPPSTDLQVLLQASVAENVIELLCPYAFPGQVVCIWCFSSSGSQSGCVSCSSVELQRLAASSFLYYFCTLPWHSVRSQLPHRSRVAFDA